MAFDALANFAYSAVATAPSPASSGTSLTVEAGAGALFPTPPFNAVVWPTGVNPEAANAEIVRVTAISTDTLTIVRKQEGTSAREIVVGDQIRAWITKKTITDIEAELSSAVLLEPKDLGEVEGVTKLVGSEGTLFHAKLKGSAEFEVSPPHEPWLAELLLEPGKYTWKVKGASWVGSEPEFGEGALILTILCWKGEVLLLAGPEGRRGEPGSNGNTVRNGEAAPEVGLGVNGDFYIRTTSGKPTSIYGPKTSGGWGSATELKGEKGTTGEKGATGEKGETGITSVDAFLKVAAPVFARSIVPVGEAVIGVAFRAIFVRVVIPVTGTLHDLAVFNESVVNGNHNVAVFDTGQTKTGEYTKLYESKSVEAKGEKEWQVLGDPALSVTAGEALMFAIMNSGTTHKFGQITGNGVGRAYELPTNFMPVSGGASPKLCALHSYGELKFATIKESEMERSALPLVIIGRIV